MLQRSLLCLILLLVVAAGARAQTDVALVLPFENTSSRSEFNWVGESFADSLSDLLRVPGLNVVTNEERKLIQQRLRIPLTALPSLATSLKLAREANATILISGQYNVEPSPNDMAAAIIVTAKVVRVNEGRFLSEEMPDGSRVTRDIRVSDALGNLQTIQGQIAYQILYQRDKSLPYSQNDMITAATKVPARAFEAYTKGLLTPISQIDVRENYFRNAVRLYSEATSGGVYSEADLELGHINMGRRKVNEAIDAFEQVITAHNRCVDRAKQESKAPNCRDEMYAEASFYIGILQWQQGNYESALATLRPLADDLKLTSIYNALGAIAIQASRTEKKNPGKAAALQTEGLELLKRAADSTPDDANIHFNYAAALFLAGNMADAAPEFRQAISAAPRDGEAYFMLSKALEAIKDPLAKDMDNEARKYLTANNRYATLEREWQRSKTIANLALRVEVPLRKDFVSVIMSRSYGAAAAKAQVTETDDLLTTARAQVKAGQDDDAMATLRRILASEPMSAESYLLLGKIHLRRGDLEQAISSFKTSIFWDNRMIEAHVALGKIYVEKGDCLQAKNYTASALDINSEDPDAIALQRLSERCSK
ncbi:MAG: tetratricopeptide repeat protein [Acidobacteria bacterium]|nr:tetratricopeptide repeat protein [Acidobacteriota bacterium]